MTFALIIRYWREGIMGLLILALGISIIAFKAEKRHSAKLAAQIVTLTAKLESITTAKNEQAQRSKESVAQVIEGQERVRTVVKTIRDAPNPEGCVTPALSTLRNEV